MTNDCIELDGCCATHSKCFIIASLEALMLWSRPFEQYCGGWPCPIN